MTIFESNSFSNPGKLDLIFLPSKLSTFPDDIRFYFAPNDSSTTEVNYGKRTKKNISKPPKLSGKKKVAKIKSVESREEILRERMNPLRYLDKSIAASFFPVRRRTESDSVTDSFEEIPSDSMSSFDDDNSSTSSSNISRSNNSSPSPQSPLMKRHFAHISHASAMLYNDVINNTPEYYSPSKRQNQQQLSITANFYERDFFSPLSELIPSQPNLQEQESPFNTSGGFCLDFELDVQAALLEPLHHLHSSHDDIQSILPCEKDDGNDDRWKRLLADDVSWL